ncbi:MAG: Molybdopterin oxidoreductase, iron-sulfur binding subunit, partial [Myxococcaceae bacterium]|nr:Molybdopterin oxidoreductase, iron-sulfur binding subunit [Myxococcaceae bacterium]
MSKRKPYQFSKPAADGKVFWTSLEAKADPAAHQKRATAEFVDGVSGSDLLSGAVSSDSLRVDRRSFIGIAGAAGALLGLEGCIRRPEDKILPFTRQPEYVLPGIALHYATTVRSGGDAIGLLVTTHEGRPTKVEGNPNHPASLGATDGYAQASILDLYDPDRSRAPAQRKDNAFTEATFADVDAALGAIATQAQSNGGAKLRVLVQPSSSPTGTRVVKALLAKYPAAKVYRYEPVSAANRNVGLKTAFGQAVDVVFGYRRARTIVALDADFLGAEPGSVRASREFADGRRLSSPRDSMSRLYVVEPGFTVTGAAADHRLRLPARDVGSYLKALAGELNALGILANAESSNFDGMRTHIASAKAPAGVSDKWLKSVAKELAAARGQSLIVVGTRQPAAVHALAFALNQALGNIGRTITLVPAIEDTVEGPFDGITALAGEIQAGTVDTLLILGGNPALDAPANLKFAELITKVPTSLHLSEYRDETSHVTSWHVPRAHAFESWGDQRSSDGTISIQQPLIAPLHGGRTDGELLAQLAGIQFWRAHALVRSSAREVFTSDFEGQWKAALHLGVARELTVAPLTTVAFDGNAVGAAVATIADSKTALSSSNLEVNFVPDPALFDGRHGNNPWMLELPDPLSCISWDNAAYLSPETAKALSVMNGDLVSVKDAAGNAIEIVTWVLPGQTDNTVTLHLGWGRTVAGRYGNHAGFNVYPIRTATAFGFGDGFTVEGIGKRYKVSQTQETHSMEGRAIAVDGTLEQYRSQPEFAEYATPTVSTLPLWKEVKYEGHKWAMTIDLNACTGCNACLVACQAENNVSSVGKEQVARGRDMYWLRLDRYFVGEDVNEPLIAFQPVACQHCEEAPCENVCPVNATAHSPEGLNDMAYNRCIGTR